MRHTFLSTLALAIVLCLSMINACTKQATVETDKSSFDLIQDKIFTTSCASNGCHASANDGSFAQHKLILAKGQAYKSLIDIAPQNREAIADGLKLVKAYNSLMSLLYHKINPDNSHHASKNYGSLMPLGSTLSWGQIEFIRRWIEAGAPEKGQVADASLLDDTTPAETAPFEPLIAPVAGTGYQMKIDPFEIVPDFEREIFVRKPMGNTTTAYVNRIQIKMRPGSHHFILYGFRDASNIAPLNVVRDLRSPNGSVNLLTFQQMGNHVFNFGGSEANLDYTFPEGTAVEIAANATFDMNSHYYNKGTRPIPGEVYINLFTTEKTKVKNTLKVLDLANNNLSLPPKQKTVVSKSFTFDKNVKVVTLFSHTHQLGEKFEILIKGGNRDGEVVYTSTNWEHPEKTNYSPYISLKKGEGLTSRITYNNTTDKVVRFGLTTEDEMGIIFGYYFEE